MAEVDGRRTRPIISCALCRRRKIKCDRETPCGNCRRSRNPNCVYKRQRTPPPTPPDSVDHASGPASPNSPFSSCILTKPPESTSSAPDTTTFLKDRIRELEIKLASATLDHDPQAPTQDQTVAVTSSILCGTFHIYSDDGHDQLHQAIPRSVAHKTRFFGQSHWAVSGIGIILDIFKAIEGAINKTDITAATTRCKQLARTIKSRRAPIWPTIPTTDLPDKALCDVLVDNYLRTSEAVFRVLHIPSFRKEYDALWQHDSKPDFAFIMQLKTILAIGAVVYDERFTLRTSALRWVCEVRCWIIEPRFKSRLALQGIQTHLLLLLACEQVGIGAEPAWIGIGPLIRRAMHMGLHRDPTQLPKMPLLVAEMRRRLWNTIIEINLLSSLAVGACTLLPLDGFDTLPPSNFDDEQLTDNEATPRPGNHFTQSTLAIALRTTFAQRSRIVKHLNGISPMGAYDVTLMLDEQLRAAYKPIAQSLHGKGLLNPEARSAVGTQIVNFIMLRFFSAVHSPYYGAAIQGTKYAYSRKICVEMALKTWALAQESVDQILSRLAINSSSFYQTVTMHAITNLLLELRVQRDEEGDFGPSSINAELLGMPAKAEEWGMSVLRSGDTNIRGVQLTALLIAHAEARKQGMDQEESMQLILDHLRRATALCEPIMQQTALELEGLGKSASQSNLTSPFDPSDDWAFFDTDTAMMGETTDPMQWMMDDFDPTVPNLW